VKISFVHRILKVIKNEGYLESLKDIFINHVMPILIMPYTKKLFYTFNNKLSTIKEIIHFAYNFKSFGLTIKPIQVYEEIFELAKIINDLKPKFVLEMVQHLVVPCSFFLDFHLQMLR